MVVKRIHQIWVGPNAIPEKSLEFIAKIKELHPDYEYKLWTDVDLTEENFSNLSYINSTPVYAQKADIMRYEILYKHGGIYLDIDFEVFKPLDSLLTHDFVVCNEDGSINDYMSIGFIYSIPGLQDLKNCIDNIHTCPLGGKVNVSTATGPSYFRRCINLANARVLPTNTMYPVHFSQKGYRPTVFGSETYAMHHWDKNW